MKTVITLLSGLMLGGGILSAQANASEAEFECVNAIQNFSNLDKMSSGDFSANGHWKQLEINSTSIGYGPAANREYELTIVDGVVIMARPGEGSDVIVRNDPRPDEGMAMIQLASPAQWGAAATLAAIATFDDLNFELDQIVDDLGCDEDVLLPFKITGQASSVTWSMDTEPSRVTESRNQQVILVGLYNRNDKRTYFMVRGYHIHAHVHMPELGYGGHLRTLNLEEGAQLYLPLKNKG